VGRVSFTGDLGYEIWMKPEYQRTIYDLLHEHGAAHGIRNVGLRAFLSLRLEKKFGTWGREYRPIYSPVECGLDRFCSTKKEADYIGRAAFEAAKAEGGKLRLKAFVVDADDADPIGDEPIYHNGDEGAVGWVTSGGFAHAAGKSVAMGYINKDVAGDTSEGGFEIEILGKRRKARIEETPLFDPNGSRMRS
jgi:dimethylglycine dehydrogenase